MKITKVETFLLEKQLTHAMHISRGGFTLRMHCLVRVTTDTGLTGLGEGIGNAPLIQAIIENDIGPRSIGLDVTDITNLKSKLIDGHVYFERKGSSICAASAIEMACWDILGKHHQVPVANLLGGKSKDTIERYASDVYWEENISNMVDGTQRILDSGITTVKIHIGYGTPLEDTARVEAVRETLPEDSKLIIDLNAGYSYFQALEAISLWEAYDITWLEEPLHPDQVSALGRLREESSIPIAAGENEFLVAGFMHLFENKAIHVAMPDIGRAGGILETRDICKLAHQNGVLPSPHNFSSGVLLAATIQLMAAVPECSLLEWDTSGNAIYEELFIEPLKKDGAHVTVPELPGLGVHLPEAILTKYQKKHTVNS